MPSANNRTKSLSASFEDIEYTVNWEVRRNIYLRIYEDGRLQLRIPMRCTIEEAEKLIKEKKSWIIKKRGFLEKRRQEKLRLYPAFKDKELLNFYDKKLMLRIEKDNKRIRNSISHDGNVLILKTAGYDTAGNTEDNTEGKTEGNTVSNTEACAGKDTDKTNSNIPDNNLYCDAVKGWYIKHGKEVFINRADYYAGLMGVTYGNISVKDQKSRWGSCSSKGNLNFSWRLLLMPEKLLDYVVVHELAHRYDIGHTKAFWAKVAEILPDYKLREHELNKY